MSTVMTNSPLQCHNCIYDVVCRVPAHAVMVYNFQPEFLTADRLAEPIRDVSQYHIRLDVAYTILAQACLGVLLRLDDHFERDGIKSFLWLSTLLNTRPDMRKWRMCHHESMMGWNVCLIAAYNFQPFGQPVVVLLYTRDSHILPIILHMSHQRRSNTHTLLTDKVCV